MDDKTSNFIFGIVMLIIFYPIGLIILALTMLFDN